MCSARSILCAPAACAAAPICRRRWKKGCGRAHSGGGGAYLVLLSDGGATRGPIQNGKLASWYEAMWKRFPPANRPRTYIFGVGDDANLAAASSAGARGRSARKRAVDRAGRVQAEFVSVEDRSQPDRPVAVWTCRRTPPSIPSTRCRIRRSRVRMAAWVGRYPEAAKRTSTFTVHGVRDGTPLAISAKASLPRESSEHPQLPRLWARARVDALLEKIEREGEDQASIDEIIGLARQYKFVTPYTSFLAVPRALLRPRVIRPGDPRASREDGRIHRFRRGAVSVRTGAKAALSARRRHLANALSCAEGPAGRNLRRCAWCCATALATPIANRRHS